MNIKLYTIIICVILIIILAILLIIKWSCKCDSYVNFVDENNKIIDINSIEKVEQDVEITTTDPIAAAKNYDQLDKDV